MFTGIIHAVGRVSTREAHGTEARLEIDTKGLGLDDIAVGDSISVAGVCLTAVVLDPPGFVAHVSAETLARTTLGALAPGDPVNLEKPLRLVDRLGGHLVSGHVDGMGRVTRIEPEAAAQRWTFAMPTALTRYIALKGSICIDGTSLTVNAVHRDAFEVTLIPHTLQATTFGQRQCGEAVNLEVDLIARYIERLYSCDRPLSQG